MEAEGPNSAQESARTPINSSSKAPKVVRRSNHGASDIHHLNSSLVGDIPEPSGGGGPVPESKDDSESDADDECRALTKIDNLVWINNSIRHRVALEEWEKKGKLFAERVDRKREKSLSVKKEIYQLVGFYGSFQGLVLGAVRTSNVLHCNSWWSAFFLSSLGSITAIAGCNLKFRTLEDLTYSFAEEELKHKYYAKRIRQLKNLGPNFDFQKHAADGMHLKDFHGRKVWRLRWLTISILCLFWGCGVAMSHHILCDPGYLLLHGPPGGEDLLRNGI